MSVPVKIKISRAYLADSGVRVWLPLVTPDVPFPDASPRLVPFSLGEAIERETFLLCV